MKLNTVHVFDVARAIYFAARKAPPGSVFNLADHGNTDQGRIVGIVGRLFGIETAFVGTMMSNIAAVREHRDMILRGGLCRVAARARAPLAPTRTTFHVQPFVVAQTRYGGQRRERYAPRPMACNVEGGGHS